MLLRVRTFAVASSLLLLAACGSMHPGSAAMVDGTSIPMKSANDLAEAYCEYNALQAQPGGDEISNVVMRQQAVTTLVSLTVARELAEENDIVPAPHSYQLSPSQRVAGAEQYPGDDEAYFKALELSQELTSIAIALGEKALGTEVTDDNQKDVLTAGIEQIDRAIGSGDIDIDPRFGLDGALAPVSSSGSLSVVDPDFASSGSLPETQRCA